MKWWSELGHLNKCVLYRHTSDVGVVPSHKAIRFWPSGTKIYRPFDSLEGFAIGPLVPFLFGSWFGYTLSCISFWRAECTTARGYVQNFPRLLEYTVRTEFPWAQMPQDVNIEKWMQSNSFVRLSWCILAGQSCQPLIHEHQEEKRKALLEPE
eukprot:symbB.v1.2.029165.t1/scaffold3163.1/size62148/6